MQLRNFVRRFGIIVMLVVFSLGSLVTTLMVLPVTTTTATTAIISTFSVDTATALSAKTYYFDRYNENTPTGESLYTSSGITVYNDYLTALSETQDLNEVIIVVIDTGLDADYPVFADRILTDYAMDFSTGLPTSTKNNWNVDQNGHGTHVAGLIADITPANVKILPIKIFDGLSGNSTNYALENAVRWICALKGGYKVQLLNNYGTTTSKYYNEAEVKLDNIVAVNMSLGTSGFSLDSATDMKNYGIEKYGYTEYGVTYTGYQTTINNLLECDILPIVAAGNRDSGEYNGKPYYSLPGSCDGVLEVSAYDNTEDEYALASFSYYNDFVSLAAPGTEIWSACSDDIVALLSSDYIVAVQTTAEYTYYVYKKGSTSAVWYLKQDANGNYYLRESGTSMATPYVTACYALLMSDSSKTTAEDYGLTSWNPEDTESDDAKFMNIAHKALLAAAATDGYHSDEGYEMKFGYGTVNVGGFVPDSETNTVRPLVEIKYELPLTEVTDDPTDTEDPVVDEPTTPEEPSVPEKPDRPGKPETPIENDNNDATDSTTSGENDTDEIQLIAVASVVGVVIGLVIGIPLGRKKRQRR